MIIIFMLIDNLVLLVKVSFLLSMILPVSQQYTIEDFNMLLGAAAMWIFLTTYLKLNT